MHDTSTPILYAPAEAARLLGVSRATVYNLLGSGDLASVHIGRSRRIAREALEAYVSGLSA